MAYERFIDRKDKVKLIEKAADFTLRRHGMPPERVIYCFMAVLLAVLVLVIHLSIKLILLPETEETPLDELLGFLVTIAILIGGVAAFLYIVVQKIRAIILETEFQNLLFASSMGIDADFAIIANQDRIVVYFNHQFNKIFSLPEMSPDPFNALISHEGLKEADANKLIKAVEESRTAKISMTLKKAKIEVRVDPLSRPRGYSTIRGYKVKK